MSYFFFLYQSPSSLLSNGFDSIPSNIDEVLSINPSADAFVFWDFNVHHKDWLTYTCRTDRPGELCYNFSISKNLTQMVNIPTCIPDSHNWIYLVLLMLVLFYRLSLHWKILIMLLFQFPLTFQKFTMGCPIASHSLWLFSCWLGWSLWLFERCFMGGYL